MKQIQLLSLSLVILGLTACGPSSTKTSETLNTAEKKGDSAIQEIKSEVAKDWQLLEKENYAISYPKDWDLDQSEQMGTKFFLFSKLSSDKDVFKDNINLIIQDLKGQNIDFKKFVEISEGQIKTMFPNSNMEENKSILLNGKTFQKVIYTGDQGEYKLRFTQYYCVENDKAYVLTFSAETKEYNALKAVGESIMNSFKVK
jgi:PsbP-like protein